MTIEEYSKDKEAYEEKISELNLILKNENLKYAELYQ